MTGVNEDTDFSSGTTCELGHVLRDIIWRILYLRKRFGRGARIVLSKMYVKDAFRQVPVEITRAPVVGYVFGGLVVIDRRLQIGWRNSPGYWCLFASALEHAALCSDSGRGATQHVVVRPPRELRAAALPPGYVALPGRGGWRGRFFLRAFLCGRWSVEMQRYPSGDRCLCALASIASNHFRLFGDRAPTDPPLL